MVALSLSVLSPLPSTSSTSSGSLSYPRFYRSFNFSGRNPKSLSHNLSPLRALNLFPSPSPAPPDDSTAPEQSLKINSAADVLRFKKALTDGCGLQTAIVSYRKKFPGSPLRVDLFSTIHIGDKEYFATLQKELELYDCVLYELLASRECFEICRNSTAKKRLKSSHSQGFDILDFIQKQSARILTLDFQLDCLDYHSENWYHADLDFETFQLLQLKRGESTFTYVTETSIKTTEAMVQQEISENLESWRSKLLWASRVLPMPLVGRLMIEGICADVGGQTSEYLELDALSRLDFVAAIKIFLAKRVTSDYTKETADVDAKSVVIGERNKAAIEALRRAVDEGHRRIAILYGSGHMADLGRRLTEEFDLVPSQKQWITAWAIRKRDLQSSSVPPTSSYVEATSLPLKTIAEISGGSLNWNQTLAFLIFSSVLAIDLWFWKLFIGAAVNWSPRIVSATIQLLRRLL